MITSAIVSRCRQIVDDLTIASDQCGALAAQSSWQSNKGGSLYGETLILPSAVNDAVLAGLPIDRQKFAGLPMDMHRRHMRTFLPERAMFRFFGAPGTWIPFRLLQAFGAAGLACWPLIAFSRAAKGLPTEYLCEMPSDVGGLHLGRYLINPETASYQERMQILYRTHLLEALKRRERPTIVEIGGGFGALAFCVKRVVPQVRYVIVDLPGSLVHSGCWLAQWRPDTSIAVYQPGSAMPGADFVLVPHTAFAATGGLTIDLAINTLSFGEMSEEIVSGYAEQIAARLASNGALFEQKRDCSCVGSASFCNPTAVLGDYFPHHRIVPGRYWCGVPSVWAT